MKYKILLIYLIFCFSIKSYGQEGVNCLLGLRTTNFINTEPIGESKFKLSGMGAALFGTNSLIEINDKISVNLNSGFMLEYNNLEFSSKNRFSLEVWSFSIPIYASLLKTDYFQFGLGAYGDLNFLKEDPTTIIIRGDKPAAYQMIFLLDYGLFSTLHYMIPNSNFNIFANYNFSLQKRMQGYQSVGNYGEVSAPFEGFNLHGISLGIGCFLLR
ncbi:hypothetical protein ABWH96_18715 [Marivirga tractuosa]|uniref:hypothetical protein n=1 Tax=Marivirga tractuosa TaxID=1006 RepID=UPI0035D087C5